MHCRIGSRWAKSVMQEEEYWVGVSEATPSTSTPMSLLDTLPAFYMQAMRDHSVNLMFGRYCRGNCLFLDAFVERLSPERKMLIFAGGRDDSAEHYRNMLPDADIHVTLDSSKIGETIRPFVQSPPRAAFKLVVLDDCFMDDVVDPGPQSPYAVLLSPVFPHNNSGGVAVSISAAPKPSKYPQ